MIDENEQVKPAGIRRTIYLPVALDEWIAGEAEAKRRSFSNMLSILISDAKEQRQ